MLLPRRVASNVRLLCHAQIHLFRSGRKTSWYRWYKERFLQLGHSSRRPSAGNSGFASRPVNGFKVECDSISDISECVNSALQSGRSSTHLGMTAPLSLQGDCLLAVARSTIINTICIRKALAEEEWLPALHYTCTLVFRTTWSEGLLVVGSVSAVMNTSKF